MINKLGIDLFSHELLSKIMSKILTDESIEISKIIDYFSKKSERDFISGLLMEEKEIKVLANSLNFNSEQTDQFSKIVSGCAKLFKDKDLSLLEINPLVVSEDGQIICLDAKINFDDNAIFRREDISKLRDLRTKALGDHGIMHYFLMFEK